MIRALNPIQLDWLSRFRRSEQAFTSLRSPKTGSNNENPMDKQLPDGD